MPLRGNQSRNKKALPLFFPLSLSLSLCIVLLLFNLVTIPPEVHATAGTATFVGTTANLTGTATAQQFIDTANSAYYLDPAATGNSLLVAGNVGIGTTNPGYTLDVNGTIRAGASALLSTGGAAGYYQDATNGAYRSIVSSATLNGYYFQTNGGAATTMYVGLGGAYNGNVGIGTTSPGQKLSVAGTVESTTGGFKFPDGSTQTAAASITSSEAVLGGDVACGAGSWCDLVSLNLGAGTYWITGQVQVLNDNTNSQDGQHGAELWNGTTVYSLGYIYLHYNTYGQIVLAPKIITLTGTTTIKITYYSGNWYAHAKAANNGTYISAIKIN